MGERTPTPDRIATITKMALKSLGATFYIENLGNIVLTKKLLTEIPMNKQSGVMWYNKHNNPHYHGMLIYTDKVDIDDWILEHNEHLIAWWNNPTPYPIPEKRYNLENVNKSGGKLTNETRQQYDQVFAELQHDCQKTIREKTLSKPQYANLHGITVSMVVSMAKKPLTSKV